jgi:EAL domain-containing protein (putative c-di-GMP-specific phosphodiesterase class I)
VEHSTAVAPGTDELREPVGADRLLVYYQPQAEVASRSICGVEALVCRQHSGQGLVVPAEFVDDAERRGPVTEVGLFVLESAIRQWKRWSERGIRLDLAVHLSTDELFDLSLLGEVTALLLEHEVPPEFLVLEITERTLFADHEHARKALKQLNRIGVRLAIDHYGTGKASLQMLRQLPLQQIKIDRSVVAGVLDDVDGDGILCNTVKLAHSLGATVIAEGVETDLELERLARDGCDVAQGSLIGEPLPADRLTPLLLPQPEVIPDPDTRRLESFGIARPAYSATGVEI